MNDFKFDVHMHLDLFKNREVTIEYIEREKSYTIAMTNLPVLYNRYISEYRELKYIRFALGFHPELVHEYENQMYIFVKCLKDAKYIGEIGLDYKIKNQDNINAQKRVFKEIINLCNKEGNKVLSVHSRSAVKDVNDIIGKFNGTVIMHWFTGNEIELNKSIDNGYYFSINEKMINTEKKKMLIKNIPIDKLLIESDAPFIEKNRVYSVDFIDNIITELANMYKLEKVHMIEQLKKNFRSAISI
ncbi:Qat anti-phage system TatD family nuclease QatD [Clostridium beijerinckii]|uniref:Putative deoxyribonuclease YcfH n=1 Tax=Clostridium beijerinckii TaxID=1520 RepID=A0A1S8S124_CLOBE|nr:Qat anti-phage system TatD family nuclease QatD [Clostridium beijerinckii]NRY64187.1 TatD DNase family protein [Clostridium beijerinckii]OOM59153.1 putative deoxyribonuclease YcfH [Clostridium beijerinckii]